MLNSICQKPDIEKIRKDIAKQLNEGLLVMDNRAREILIVDGKLNAKIKAVAE